MATESVILECEHPATVPARPEVKELRKVIAEIRSDAQQEPEAYLEQTEVPHGGE